jgi:hypothetical protein
MPELFGQTAGGPGVVGVGHAHEDAQSAVDLGHHLIVDPDLRLTCPLDQCPHVVAPCPPPHALWLAPRAALTSNRRACGSPLRATVEPSDSRNPHRALDRTDDQTGAPITIDGLWGLRFGNSTFGGAGSLIFSAGLNDENDGLLGLITPAVG